MKQSRDCVLVRLILEKIKSDNSVGHTFNWGCDTSEISEMLNISRNAVWDALQKACSALEEYETKLQMHKNVFVQMILKM